MIAFLAAALLSAEPLAERDVIPLWDSGAPGFEDLRSVPERQQDWWVDTINNPTLTVYRPDEPNGVGVIVVPGGGLKKLVVGPEGNEAAAFLNSLGVSVPVPASTLNGPRRPAGRGLHSV